MPGLRALKVPVIPDPPDIQRAAQREGRRLGPLAGILAGMEWALKHHPHAGWILTAPADVPFLPLDLTVRLCGHMHVPEPDVLMVRHGRHREPSLAVWSVKLADDLRRAILEEGMRRVEAVRRAPRRWPNSPGRATPAPFLNINTPAELTRRGWLGWLELDHAPVDEELAGILEIDGDAMADHRLDLAQAPVRPSGWRTKSPGESSALPGLSNKFRDRYVNPL